MLKFTMRVHVPGDDTVRIFTSGDDVATVRLCAVVDGRATFVVEASTGWMAIAGGTNWTPPARVVLAAQQWLFLQTPSGEVISMQCSRVPARGAVVAWDSPSRYRIYRERLLDQLQQKGVKVW